jgi:hypothetical protein
VSKRVLVLIGGVGALWLLLALPARHLAPSLGGGDEAVKLSGLAALLCLVPAMVVLVWADWAFRQNAEQQTYAILGGGGVRMFFVLGAAVVLTQGVGLFPDPLPFYMWLGIFYLATLALEVGLMVAARQPKNI